MPNLNILVVEDEDAICRLLKLALSGFGFSVKLASTGMQAIDIYKREAIDVVLMDVQMPDMDGLETMAALKKIDAEVICCFMSGDPGRYSAEELVRLGSAGLMQKPFRLEELRQFILRAARTGGQRPKTTKQFLPQRDRRIFPRQAAEPEIKIACLTGCLRDGLNLAISLLDFSETGFRLLLHGPLEVGQEIVVTLGGAGLMKPMSFTGKVVWVEQKVDGYCSVGVLLDRCLSSVDLSRFVASAFAGP